MQHYYISLLCKCLLFDLAIVSSAAVVFQGYAPSSRKIEPVDVYRTTGNVLQRPDLSPFTFTLTGSNASVTFDFGGIIAGLPCLEFLNSTCGTSPCTTANLPGQICTDTCQAVGLAYSEAERFVGPESDLSTFYTVPDGTIYLPILSNQLYTPPGKWARGGFRYLTLSLGSNVAASTSVTVAVDHIFYTANPNLGDGDLNQYTGHFKSTDSELNEIWYAGAYTLQLNTIAANTTVQSSYMTTGGGWSQDATGTSLNGSDIIIVDGAKRNRNSWAGDLSISLRTALVAQNNDHLLAVRNVLRACFILQDNDTLSPTYGYFPYAGSPLGDLFKLFPTDFAPYSSDTYHLYTIYMFSQYVLAVGDTAFLSDYWQQIVTGMSAMYRFIDSDGLFNGTRTVDWGRVGQGGKNSALNAICYATLTSLVVLTSVYPEQTPLEPGSRSWSTMAEELKVSYNLQLWDPVRGLYKDNTTVSGSMVYPQDGNSFAIEFNVTDSNAKAELVAGNLASRLTQSGAPCPELPGSISPYVGGHELVSQFQVAEFTGNVSAAMNLLRTQWGYMRREFSNTTFIEGYGVDGSLDYVFYMGKPNFVSFAHAWSTGPVYSLMHDVVGIRATRLDVPPSEGHWAVKPLGALSDLMSASGGIKVPRGSFNVTWQRTSHKDFQMMIDSPVNMSGTIYVPTFGKHPDELLIYLNSERVIIAETSSKPFVRIPNVTGGRNEVKLMQQFAEPASFWNIGQKLMLWL